MTKLSWFEKFILHVKKDSIIHVLYNNQHQVLKILYNKTYIERCEEFCYITHSTYNRCFCIYVNNEFTKVYTYDEFLRELVKYREGKELLRSILNGETFSGS